MHMVPTACGSVTVVRARRDVGYDDWRGLYLFSQTRKW